MKIFFVKIDGGGILKEMKRFCSYTAAEMYADSINPNFKIRIVPVPLALAYRYEKNHNRKERL